MAICIMKVQQTFSEQIIVVSSTQIIKNHKTSIRKIKCKNKMNHSQYFSGSTKCKRISPSHTIHCLILCAIVVPAKIETSKGYVVRRSAGPHSRNDMRYVYNVYFMMLIWIIESTIDQPRCFSFFRRQCYTNQYCTKMYFMYASSFS